MIHKVHFGKRVGIARRRLGISQAELAERLNVTPQAVSKWECGSAIPDVELLLALSHLFGTTVNDLLEDADPIAAMNIGGEYADGVHYFVPRAEDPRRQDFADALRREGWIGKNWRASQEVRAHPFLPIGRRIAMRGGLILEIGAGPGGGFMPFVLRADPNAEIIVSDLSPAVVEEWRRFLDAETGSPNLWFAACDFTALPFPDNSFSIVSDAGGVANCIGDRRKALREICRVLRPDGLFVTYSGFISRDTLDAIPDAARVKLRAEFPEAFEDLYEETVLAGFRRVDSEAIVGWDTDHDESGFAARCRELDVHLSWTGYVRYCYKS
ncbi:MAG: methyltransferase domain-containing protein [Clostridia bacterium]|nr:methyltransferase domain-containing protein [Clostridia bacterium]